MVGRLGLVGVDEGGGDDVKGDGQPVGVGRSLGRCRGRRLGLGLATGALALHPDAPAPVAARFLLDSRARDYALLLRGRELGAAWRSYGSNDRSRRPRN